MWNHPNLDGQIITISQVIKWHSLVMAARGLPACQLCCASVCLSSKHVWARAYVVRVFVYNLSLFLFVFYTLFL